MTDRLSRRKNITACRAPAPTPSVVYERLLNYFGPQGWWPVTPPGSPAPGYHPGTYLARREAEMFEICAGAILTQNTAWANVEKALGCLSLAGIRGPRALRKLPERELAWLIRSSGYFNQKARRLRSFAGHIIRRHRGKFSALFNQPPGRAREELLSLNGIGPETADSMLLYAGGKRTFVVDAYTRRLGERLGWSVGDDYGQIKRFFEERLTKSVPVYNEFHALIVAHAKKFCRKQPACAACPLAAECPRKI